MIATSSAPVHDLDSAPDRDDFARAIAREFEAIAPPAALRPVANDEMIPSFSAYADYILPRANHPQTASDRAYIETVTAAYRLGLAIGRAAASMPTRQCRVCHGTGLESDAPGMSIACWPTRCPDCLGAGVVPLAVPVQFAAD